MIVVDTSFLIHFYLPSDFSPITERVFEKDSQWIAPGLWKSEFRNVITGFIRKKIIDFSKGLEIMEKAEMMMHGGEVSVSSAMVLELARESTCSAYDCEFVALAKSRNLALLTWDSAILKSFPRIGVTPEKFLAK